LELWQYVRHQTDSVPEQETDLLEIKQLLIDMQKHISKSSMV